MSSRLSKIDVVILCGGEGRRLKPMLADRPKVLAPVGEEAFLDILLENLSGFGFKKIILCVGYRKGEIINHFKDASAGGGYSLVFSEEEEPLGTGGALKRARPLIGSNTFLVLNGDSFCEVDFDKLLDFHVNKRSRLTMVLAKSKVPADYGSIKLDESGRIEGYQEKVSFGGEAIINAGIYLVEKEVLGRMPDKETFSLEYDFFPNLKGTNSYGYLTESTLYDIGTPEKYALYITKRLKHEGETE